MTWIAIVAPLPYSLSRLLWAAGIPVGIDAQMLHDDLQAPGWGSLQILLLAGLCEATALYTAVFIRDRADRAPRWLPLVGGRPAHPWLVVFPLLAPIAILAAFNVWSVGLVLNGFTIPADNAGVPAWSFWGQVTVFMAWGVCLTAATVAYLLERARQRWTAAGT